MKAEQLQYLPHAALRPAPYNRHGGGTVRSGFAEKELRELADSIRAQATVPGVAGIIQPLVVRKLKDEKFDYEIVAGERRWTAAGMVDKKLKVPCVVRDYDEVAAREINAIENLQRVGVHFIEEAQGFQDLLDLPLKDPHTRESIAKAIGKSPGYVHARLKLLRMPPLARSACLLGKMDHSLALLVARIPDPKLAHKACLEILAPMHRNEEAALDRELEPLSFRAAKELIQTNYMVRLKDAPFKQEDPDLVPISYLITAGSESENVELLYDVVDGCRKIKPDEPLAPQTGQVSSGQIKLFDSSLDDGQGHKRTVYYVHQNGKDLFGPASKANAEKFFALATSGQPVTVQRAGGGPCGDCPFRTGNLKALFPDVASADVCTNPGCFKRKKDADFKRAAALAKEDGVTLLKERESTRLFDNGKLLETGTGYVDLADPAPGKAKQTWEKFLGDALPQDKVIQARDDQTPPQIHLLLPVADAFAAAQVKEPKLKAPPATTPAAPEDREAEEAERKERQATAQRALDDLLTQVRAKVVKQKPDKKFYAFLVTRAADGTFCDRHKLSGDKQVTQFLNKRSEAELRALLVEALCVNNPITWQGDFYDGFKDLCTHYKLDPKAALKRAAKLTPPPAAATEPATA